MAMRGGGHVINVSSGNAFYPTPGAAAYGASKAFVNSLSAALAHELRASGVGVTAVCPGFTETGAQERLGLNRDVVPRLLLHQPDEVARKALRAAARGKAVSALDASGGREDGAIGRATTRVKSCARPRSGAPIRSTCG